MVTNLSPPGPMPVWRVSLLGHQVIPFSVSNSVYHLFVFLFYAMSPGVLLGVYSISHILS